ncbi:hypothetical protein [Nonomuraea typhae]|uniref:Uncharacterized protein n=1 Tax=Nonomuraea typhae TaxID=2603600 RepID=A0ABW7YVC6_9ACTN
MEEPEMLATTAANLTSAQRALAQMLAEWGMPDPDQKAADAVTLLMRYGMRPTSARPPLPVPRRHPRDPRIAQRGAAEARRLLAARHREDA